ncbi:MAG: hypothetical protein K5665_07375 [Saccharofermentans sp.]|nr:hypothetical protein [Saccharofermentans sp.]
MDSTGGVNSSQKGTKSGGFDGFIFATVMIIAAVLVFGALISSFIGKGSGNKVERSTVNRESLLSSECNAYEKWYQDDWGDWIDENGEEESLINGMKYFYDKTGVQPYLWITGEEGRNYISEGSIEKLSLDTYKDMFGDDEGHLLVIFREYPNSSSIYVTSLRPGSIAESKIMDEQAREIFLDYIDYYYTDTDLNEGQFFAKVFEKSGDRIMKKQLSLGEINAVIAVVLILVGAAVIVVHIIRKRKVAEATMKASKARAEKEQKQNEFAQQKYNDQMETTYIAVSCPNCGSSGNKVRKGNVGYCSFCGSSFIVDAEGNVRLSGEADK